MLFALGMIVGIGIGFLIVAWIFSFMDYNTVTPDQHQKKPDCHCYECNKDYYPEGSVLPYTASRMILCPVCGNKRCPHATNHNHACTHSNDPGQPGSRYT